MLAHGHWQLKADLIILVRPNHLADYYNWFTDQSYDSEISNDYAIPPDAASDANSLLPASASSRLSSYDSPRKCGTEKTLEKCGYLTKLGGKIKSWKRRYFVLKNGTLSYWKSQVGLAFKMGRSKRSTEKCLLLSFWLSYIYHSITS